MCGDSPLLFCSLNIDNDFFEVVRYLACNVTTTRPNGFTLKSNYVEWERCWELNDGFDH